MTTGRSALFSRINSSSPAHFSFDPNLPLPADHIAAGSPLFDTLSGL